MKKTVIFGIPLVCSSLSGCFSMSGLDGSSHFSCKAPDGVLCESMSGVYANAQAHNLPGQNTQKKGVEVPPPASSGDAGVLSTPITSGTPLRSAPTVLRIWLSPWEDSDGDLHDQSYIYVTLNTGHWLIEHNRRRIQDAFAPVRAPVGYNKQQTSSNPNEQIKKAMGALPIGEMAGAMDGNSSGGITPQSIAKGIMGAIGGGSPAQGN